MKRGAGTVGVYTAPPRVGMVVHRVPVEHSVPVGEELPHMSYPLHLHPQSPASAASIAITMHHGPGQAFLEWKNSLVEGSFSCNHTKTKPSAVPGNVHLVIKAASSPVGNGGCDLQCSKESDPWWWEGRHTSSLSKESS